MSISDTVRDLMQPPRLPAASAKASTGTMLVQPVYVDMSGFDAGKRVGSYTQGPAINTVVSAYLMSARQHFDTIHPAPIWTSAMIAGGGPVRINRHRRLIADRIDELRRDAVDEGETVNEQSVAALYSFCDDLAADVAPAVFRLPNGNLRAVWQSGNERIAIQFLENGRVQHVVIHHPDGRLEQDLGEHSDPLVVRGIVLAMKLAHLWHHG